MLDKDQIAIAPCRLLAARHLPSAAADRSGDRVAADFGVLGKVSVGFE